MNRLTAILLASLLPALTLAGPVMVLEVLPINADDWPDGDAPYAWVMVADTAEAQTLWQSYTNTGGYFEGMPVTGRWHAHLQDGRAGGGPSCETGDLMRQSNGRKWLLIESEEPRHWTDYPERLVIPCLDEAERTKFEKRAKEETFHGKKVKVQKKDK